jgi:hypothetical protein
MPAGFPFYPDRENILEDHGLIFTFPPLINLNLKITDLRVRGIEDAAPVQLRCVHQRDIDQGSDINQIGMAHVMPGDSLHLMIYNTCHIIHS